MNRAERAVGLRRTLAVLYQLLDALNAAWAEQQAEGPVTIQERIAASSVRQTLQAGIADCYRKLGRLARQGGHGHRVTATCAGRGAQKGHEAVRARPVPSSQDVVR